MSEQSVAMIEPTIGERVGETEMVSDVLSVKDPH
jgi:hypothetical protein